MNNIRMTAKLQVHVLIAPSLVRLMTDAALQAEGVQRLHPTTYSIIDQHLTATSAANTNKQ